MQSFSDLGVSRPVADALAARGFDRAFPVQSLVLPDALAGTDVLVKSPTGSGKTLAFAVPIVERIQASDRRAAALVLAPTRELAIQIVEETRELARSRALTVAAVYGGAGIERQSKAAARAHIIVATPGRLEDLIARGAVTLEHVRILVLDEADRMLDMGFRPAVDRIVARVPRRRQTLFFSATLDGEVRRVAQAFTHEARTHSHTPHVDRRGDVEHRFVRVGHADKVGALVRELRQEDRGLTLVFVRTKRGADRLVKRLRTHDIEALAMHGNKSQGQRERALASFGAGRVDTLVATDVAARGLDVDDITHVINYDAPDDRDGYVHRVGRTGRAGRNGTGVTFVIPDQLALMGQIGRDLALDDELAESGIAVAAPSRRGARERTRSASAPRPTHHRGGGRSGSPRNRARRRRGGGGAR
ncbi:MAG: ATP-dependent helicase RhlE [Thermoleophilaceae bacterium]|nr:ATP-dependent helicase RhlE [Thermoleophilaceae bacterium]